MSCARGITHQSLVTGSVCKLLINMEMLYLCTSSDLLEIHKYGIRSKILKPAFEFTYIENESARLIKWDPT